jgi:RNA polymerase sigma-70 factor (ECF subfamily)
VRDFIEETYRRESRRILATLVRLLGDWDLAEEALQDAFAEALEHWPAQGVPDHPRAWLVSAGRFRAIDKLRRRARQAPLPEGYEDLLRAPEEGLAPAEELPDDRLRMIFTCCHPALSQEARLALTLREVCGLATEAIASAFLCPPATVAQRIVRAKAKIRDAGIPFAVPEGPELAARLETVLHAVYLVFNEGYHGSDGSDLLRPDLTREAIRLGELLLELAPDEEVKGLLALMLFQDSRRAARLTAEGEIALLEDQDRALWDKAAIARGQALLDEAFASGRIGPYCLQAAIASLHAAAPTAAETDWPQIAGLYQVLRRSAPSPVIDLNAAVAEGMARGPEEGLRRVDALMAGGNLDAFALAHATRAAFLERCGRRAEAREAYARALERIPAPGPQRRFVERKLRALEGTAPGGNSYP